MKKNCTIPVKKLSSTGSSLGINHRLYKYNHVIKVTYTKGTEKIMGGGIMCLIATR